MPDSVSRLDLNLISRNNSPLSHSFRPTQDPRTLDEPAVESLSLIRPLFLRCPACNFTGVCAICHLGQTFLSLLDCTQTCFHSGSFFADRYAVRRADVGIRRYRGSPSAFPATKSSSRGGRKEDTFDNSIVLGCFSRSARPPPLWTDASFCFSISVTRLCKCAPLIRYIRGADGRQMRDLPGSSKNEIENLCVSCYFDNRERLLKQD